jgi:hypothetical protein
MAQSRQQQKGIFDLYLIGITYCQEWGMNLLWEVMSNGGINIQLEMKIHDKQNLAVGP